MSDLFADLVRRIRAAADAALLPETRAALRACAAGLEAAAPTDPE